MGKEEKRAAAKSFKDLLVWQKSHELAKRIYKLSKAFPKEEVYGLTSQLRRAAVSVPANIAEGQSRHHLKEYLQGLYIARGSLGELDTHLIVSERLGYISKEDLQEMEKSIIDVQKPLQGLINTLKARD